MTTVFTHFLSSRLCSSIFLLSVMMEGMSPENEETSEAEVDLVRKNIRHSDSTRIPTSLQDLKCSPTKQVPLIWHKTECQTHTMGTNSYLHNLEVIGEKPNPGLRALEIPNHRRGAGEETFVCDLTALD